MFPRFDNLIAAELDHNCAVLRHPSLADHDEAICCLTRIADAYRRVEAKRSPASGPEAQRSHSLDDDPLWYQTLKRVLQEAASPQIILHAVDQYLGRSRDLDQAFSLFEETPRSLEILARLSCCSSFLTQILINEPGSLADLARDQRTAEMKCREDFRDAALAAIRPEASQIEQLHILRAFQRHEILRIGLCDAFGLLDLKFVTNQISLLADALVQVCLKLICDEDGISEPPFSVIALGKLGGEELNYSSDIDLILVAEHSTPTAQRIARRLIELLSQHAASGFLYRVDMRLRPWGDAGPLVTTPEAYHQYLENDAELWEKQALLKARLIAGVVEPGTQFLNRLPELLFSESEADVLNSIRRMKGYIEERLRQAGRLETEVKLGAGSIRDVEFMVQALQLLHGGKDARVYSPNTLDALVRLAEHGILNAFQFRQLREGYIFLRTVEHALQLAHNLQIHQLPDNHLQLDLLARRLDYSNRLDLMQRFNEHRRAVRRTFQQYFKMSKSRDVSGNSAAAVRKTDSVQEQDKASQQPEHSPASESKAARGRQATPQRQSHRLKEVLEESEALHQTRIDEMLEELSQQNCCAVRIRQAEDHGGCLIVTIAGLETPEALSMICGYLVNQHLDIREAAVCTSDSDSEFGQRPPDGYFVGFFAVEPVDPGGDCRSVQQRFTAEDLRDLTASLQSNLCRMMLDLREGRGQRMREELVEIICARMDSLRQPPSVNGDLEIRFREEAGIDATVLEIKADDSPGFFLELAGALALFGYRIRSAELNSSKGRIFDVLEITGGDGLPIATQSLKDELVAAVTIVKQFTQWLPSNSDPLNALLRFRDLLKTLMAGPARDSDVARLNQPTILRDISHVLGLSRYLWEDFLMARNQDFLDFIDDRQRLKSAIRKSDMEPQLDVILASVPESQATAALNLFKDRHLFRIDLRHVLGHCRPFGQFSREITELAEIVLSKAGQIAWKKLAGIHGQPRAADNEVCRFCIAALGKFGGIEMGFASDLELFLIYEDEGQTDGAVPISNAGFFERLVSVLTETISARHKGIFEIDLRMRPHGRAGSAAVSLHTFRTYFGPGGDCWPYERQSMVKLRPVGGSSEFRVNVHQARDALVYDGRPFDFDAMRAFREQQVRQLVRAGTINAKLSHGGLVDCEYAVQALQMTFGPSHTALRTPNTLAALNAARDFGFVTSEQHRVAKSAYRFLRETIDCLRMVRGNAMDLTVPPQRSPDFIQLARRMERVHDSEIPLQDLENQMQAIREFAAAIAQICTE